MKLDTHLRGMPRGFERPLMDDPTVADDRTLARRRQALVEGQSILLADDDTTMRLTMCRQLALLGWACTVTTDARQALHTWQQRPSAYWLVLIDLEAQRSDGFDLARAIRAHSSAGARIPILAYSSTPSGDVDERCRRAGIDECLADPVPTPVLRKTLDRWRPRSRGSDLAMFAW
jgi:CheY-like chemotaxis protein